LFNDIDHLQRMKLPVASDKDLLDILRVGRINNRSSSVTEDADVQGNFVGL
jgi:hypothetical protein